MITLEHDQLVIRFPETHPDAVARISFQRTLRLPDDGNTYPLPPGLGRFPMFHVEDYAQKLPERWTNRGGVFFPMYQSEALWLDFSGRYPIALQIAAGKINAVNAKPWQEELHFDPQGYVVTDTQPWLDGFCVEKGKVRQFVAAPLGSGFSVEEQITGEAEFGGIQIKAFPMKAEAWERLQQAEAERASMGVYECMEVMHCASLDMGLGMGGAMHQEIYDDPYQPGDWETSHSARCFVHLINSEAFADVTGCVPPHRPYRASDYTNAGLPWFDWYDDTPALDGAKGFEDLKTHADFEDEDEPSLELEGGQVIKLGPSGKKVSDKAW